MTKGDALAIVAACSADDLSDTLLELAVTMKLEEGHSPEEILEMTDIVLDDTEIAEDDNNE